MHRVTWCHISLLTAELTVGHIVWPMTHLTRKWTDHDRLTRCQLCVVDWTHRRATCRPTSAILVRCYCPSLRSIWVKDKFNCAIQLATSSRPGLRPASELVADMLASRIAQWNMAWTGLRPGSSYLEMSRWLEPVCDRLETRSATWSVTWIA